MSQPLSPYRNTAQQSAARHASSIPSSPSRGANTYTANATHVNFTNFAYSLGTTGGSGGGGGGSTPNNAASSLLYHQQHNLSSGSGTPQQSTRTPTGGGGGGGLLFPSGGGGGGRAALSTSSPTNSTLRLTSPTVISGGGNHYLQPPAPSSLGGGGVSRQTSGGGGGGVRPAGSSPSAGGRSPNVQQHQQQPLQRNGSGSGGGGGSSGRGGGGHQINSGHHHNHHHHHQQQQQHQVPTTSLSNTMSANVRSSSTIMFLDPHEADTIDIDLTDGGGSGAAPRTPSLSFQRHHHHNSNNNHHHGAAAANHLHLHHLQAGSHQTNPPLSRSDSSANVSGANRGGRGTANGDGSAKNSSNAAAAASGAGQGGRSGNAPSTPTTAAMADRGFSSGLPPAAAIPRRPSSTSAHHASATNNNTHQHHNGAANNNTSFASGGMSSTAVFANAATVANFSRANPNNADSILDCGPSTNSPGNNVRRQSGASATGASLFSSIGVRRDEREMTRTGWLEKFSVGRGFFPVKNWQRRWFSITADGLNYAKKPTGEMAVRTFIPFVACRRPELRLQPVFLLPTISTALHPEASDPKYYYFGLRFEEKGRPHVLLIRATTYTERDAWVRFLAQFLHVGCHGGIPHSHPIDPTVVRLPDPEQLDLPDRLQLRRTVVLWDEGYQEYRHRHVDRINRALAGGTVCPAGSMHYYGAHGEGGGAGGGLGGGASAGGSFGLRGGKGGSVETSSAMSSGSRGGNGGAATTAGAAGLTRSNSAHSGAPAAAAAGVSRTASARSGANVATPPNASHQNNNSSYTLQFYRSSSASPSGAAAAAHGDDPYALHNGCAAPHVSPHSLCGVGGGADVMIMDDTHVLALSGIDPAYARDRLFLPDGALDVDGLEGLHPLPMGGAGDISSPPRGNNNGASSAGSPMNSPSYQRHARSNLLTLPSAPPTPTNDDL